MFDELVQLDDAALLAAMSESLRVERAAAARRLLATGVLANRREARRADRGILRRGLGRRRR